MADGRSNRTKKTITFIDRLQRDRNNNIDTLIKKAKTLKLEGFESISWESLTWTITAGRLVKQAGKNTTSSKFNFMYSPSLGGQPIPNTWADLAKALFKLRFHRKNQAASNQRNFIIALGYIANSANMLGQNIQTLTPEALDLACSSITKHYSNSVAYNLHKAVSEIASHCDANGLCRIIFKYKYNQMRRPNNVGGLEHKRLDNPKTSETKNEKLIEPAVFKVLGELYQKVPTDHKYRFYILLLTLLACLGRRFSEITLLPYQKIKKDFDGREYIEYFPRKISQGDTFTPKRKLYMPSEVLPIVRSIIDELDKLCLAARETAAEMQRSQSADLCFLKGINSDQRLYKEDLKKLNLPIVALDSNGWIRKNGYSFPDNERLTRQGKKPSYPIQYTDKKGITEYCNKDYSSQLVSVIHIDQHGNKYFLKDLMLVRHLGLSSGFHSHWIASQCTHSMLTTFMRYFKKLAEEYTSLSIEVDFTSHHFRHTLNMLLDEGGLSDLLQTEWFGRSNPKDTKAYQHTSREKRALMLREDIKKGLVGGKFINQIKAVPITIQDAILKIRVQAVHDVGIGLCIHNFSQIPCERHLQCSAECDDYVWLKDDKSRLEEQKRQLALTILSRKTAEEQLNSKKPKKSRNWLIHNDKKIRTLKTQLSDNGIINFNLEEYLKGLNNV